MRAIAFRLDLATFAMLGLAACNPFNREPVTSVSRDAMVNSRWRAALVTPSSLVGAIQINGSATMQPGKNTSLTDAFVTIANATPGGRHPWHVHRGQCGMDEGMIGDPAAYAPLQVGDEGRGGANATLSLPMPTSGSYFVMVQASAANPETIIACGNLAPPAQ